MNVALANFLNPAKMRDVLRLRCYTDIVYIFYRFSNSFHSSGSDEEYNERDALLTELLELLEEIELEKKPVKEKKTENKAEQKERENEKLELGKFIRDQAMQSLKKDCPVGEYEL